MEPNSIVRYAFPFRNVGDADLEIKTVKKSCGCTKYTLANKIIAPGQSGIIEGINDLGGKDGYIDNRLYVVTSSAITPSAVLRMVAGAPRTRVLSAQRVSLGDIPQGGKITREFYALDPGFGGMKLRDVYFEQTVGKENAEYLTSSVNYGVLGSNAQRVADRSGFRGRPEDYIIQLEIKVSEGCPAGPIQGRVVATVEADVGVSTHTVLVDGSVVRDVYPLPSVALITPDGEGRGSATIQLRSRQDYEIHVVKTWTDDGTPIRIERVAELPAAFVLSVDSESSVVSGAAPMQSTAFFKLGSGIVIPVPIAIYSPPRI